MAGRAVRPGTRGRPLASQDSRTIPMKYLLLLIPVLLLTCPGALARGETCLTATPLPDGAGALPFDTSGALDEGTAPSCGVLPNIDLWYRWSPDISGNWLFSTCNAAGFDTRLTIWSACAGAELACNDDSQSCVAFTSEIVMNGMLETSDYWIEVGGYAGAAGSGTMTLTFLPPTPNETCSAPTPISGAGSHPFSNQMAHSDGIIVDSSCASTGTSGEVFNDVWYEWTADFSGSASATLNTSADLVIGVLGGATCGAQLLDCDDTVAPGGDRVLWPVQAGNHYLIVIGGWAENAPSSGGAGTIDIVPFVPPPNDTCLSATLLPGGPTSAAFDTSFAAGTGLQPTCGDAGDDVWFSWTAAASGHYVFGTCNSSFDTLVSVYSSCAGGQLACNDNSLSCGPGSEARVLNMTTGQSCVIQVGGANNEVGTGTLQIGFAPPPIPGDTCASAIQLPVGPQSFDFDSALAVPTGVAPSCGGPTPPADIWYEWIPNASTAWVLSTCDMTTFDTRIALYTGCAGSELGCNDDAPTCTGFTSKLTVPGLSAGASYFIQVGGFNGASGTATLDLSNASSPAAVGTPFCSSSPNSYGGGALMDAWGSSSHGANDLVLRAGPFVPGEPGLFYYGPSTLAALPFGNGFRCVGGAAGTVTRVFPFLQADIHGYMTGPVDNTNPIHAQLAPGATLHFQAWYRDPADGGLGFNLSDGLTVLIAP